MTNRGWVLLALGTTLLGVGLLALKFPVFLDAYDQWGWRIKCGTGYSTNLLQAQVANQATPNADFIGQCQSALAMRRAWGIPLALSGWIVLSGLVIALWRHASPDQQHTSREREKATA